MGKSIDELKEGIAEVSDRTLSRLLNDERQGVRALAKREQKRRKSAEMEVLRLEALLKYERDLWRRGVLLVCGVDEVGVGPLAGPVVAGAVILPADTSLPGVDDSKKLDHEQRLALAEEVKRRAIAWAIGHCDVTEIDTLNILRASCEAMRRAVTGLGVAPEHLLVDARTVPGVRIKQTPIIGGDALSQSIAAASIVAKIERDAWMERYAIDYPGYGFERHKGYSTAEHFAALKRLGPTPLHRRSFAPVAEAEGRGRLPLL